MRSMVERRAPRVAFAPGESGLYAIAMRVFCSVLLALLAAMVASGVAVAGDRPLLTPSHRAALRCAAVFAFAAGEQERGGAAALALPPLEVRGRRYYADTRRKVAAEAGLSADAVHGLLVEEAARLQRTAGSDPDAALTAAVTGCLPRLDASVPPLRVPDVPQCAAIMRLAYEEVHAREGLSPAARDLDTLASVLATRAREALVAGGRSGDSADAAIEAARQAMAREAGDKAGGVEKYEIGHCYDLARPEPKSHY